MKRDMELVAHDVAKSIALMYIIQSLPDMRAHIAEMARGMPQALLGEMTPEQIQRVQSHLETLAGVVPKSKAIDG